ncbi:MAG TPA: OmpA family protein [Kofleriaceae bacterium]|nr:OmpA family protein [Kofleriaceae bacterium]
MSTPTSRTLLPLAAGLAATWLGAGAAGAERTWLLTADAPAAVPVSTPQNDWFAAGALPSVSLARAVGGAGVLVGARLRGGVLAEGDRPDAALEDKSTGGLGSLTLGVRVRPLGGGARLGEGLWIEAAGGGALTGRDARATAELGVGWGFAAGPVALGPSIRYLQVFQPDDQLSPGDARLALLGLEVALFDREERAAGRLVVRAARPRRTAAAPVVVVADGDGDRILDVDDACPATREVENGVDDDDGCPDEGLFEVIEDRIALDDTVLFGFARARVSSRGRKVLAAIAGYLAQHPEFYQVQVEGHADERGTDEYNLALSQRRAENVRSVLVDMGVRVQLDVEGRGESSPRAEGSDERAWRQNRRVEFVLVRHQERTAEVSR